jgi:hypothetical protein
MKAVLRLILLFTVGTGLAFAHDPFVVLRANQSLPASIREIWLKNRVGTISIHGIAGSSIHVRALLKPRHGKKVVILDLFTWGGGNDFSKQTMGGAIHFLQESHDRLRIALDLPHDPHLKDLTIDWRLGIPQTKAVRITNHIGSLSVSRMVAKVRAKDNIGLISIRDSSGPIMARTNIGKIKISGITRSLFVKTNVGSVKVQGAITSIGTVDLRSNVGSVHLRGLPHFSAQSSGLSGHFLYHGTGHHRIRIKVNVGSIRLDLIPPHPKPIHR